MEQFIETHSGHKFPLLHPTVDDFILDDMAWALSEIKHFNGHSDYQLPVALHSLLVFDILWFAGNSPDVCDAGLIHDCSEYITGDMASPLKYLPGMEKFLDIEREFQDTIDKKFNISLSDEDRNNVKAADIAALVAEREQLFKNKQAVDNWPNNIIEKLDRNGYSKYLKIARNHLPIIYSGFDKEGIYKVFLHELENAYNRGLERGR